MVYIRTVPLDIRPDPRLAYLHLFDHLPSKYLGTGANCLPMSKTTVINLTYLKQGISISNPISN